MRMELIIVLSTQMTQFQAVALKGSFRDNVAKIAGWGYYGVELAIRDPKDLDIDELDTTLSACGLAVPAIGTGYQGFVSGEFMPLPDADTAAQRAIGWLRDL